MGDRHWTSLSDLFPETGDNRTVATQYVSKTGRNETRLAFHLSSLDRKAQALYVDFSQALATAHDVRGVHRLICTDHHKLLHTITYSGICHHTGTEHVCSNRLAGVLFHQGDMLVGRRMEHHLGVPVAEHIIHTVRATDIADYWDKV